MGAGCAPCFHLENDMVDPASYFGNETARKIKENTKVLDDVSQIAIDAKMVSLFAKMVKKTDEDTQAAV